MDQMEVGYITEIEAKSVEPLEKLSVTGAGLRDIDLSQAKPLNLQKSENGCGT